MDLKINMKQYKLKFKNKIPIDDEDKFASNLIYYFPYFDVLDKETMKLGLEEIKEKTEEADDEFHEIKKEFSDLLGDIAKIRLQANELYSQNRVIALTTGLLRHKLNEMQNKSADVPFDYEETIEFVEHFIYRYLTKKQDKRLVKQLKFEER